MNIDDYLKNELATCTQYELSDAEKAQLSPEGIEEFLYKKLTSKKFRKWAMTEDAETQVRGAIHIAVSQNKPLQFRFPFGGYKLWRLPAAPEVDWAELFMIAYYCRYLAPVAAAYKPGLELLFASDDMLLDRMDNLPKSDTDAYFNSFKKLLTYFQPHFPDNLKVDIVRIADLYKDDMATMEEELAANLKTVTEKVQGLDGAVAQKRLTTSELNIKWDGVEDFTQLSAEEKQQKIAFGPILHDAYCALPRRRAFNRGEDKIVIFCTVIPNAIAIGSTKASVTKFWTGQGVLERAGDGFKARILSPKQWEAFQAEGFESVKSSLLEGKNFATIPVRK